MKKLFIFLLLFVFFFFKPQSSFADVIHSFDVNILSHKDGTMDITETINYDFEAFSSHGIFRDIPLFTSVGNLYRNIQIQNVNVLRDLKPENFTLTNNAKNLDIKIGNPNLRITGSHVYKISYKVTNGIGSNYSDHDEIYWNATGNGWQINIENASANVTTDFGVKQSNFLCLQGPFGSKNSSCTILENFATSSQILSPGEGLTIVASYPVGTFPKSTLSKNPPTTFSEAVFSLILNNYLYIWIFLNIFLAGTLILWYQRHKNRKSFGKPTVNFDIPKDEKGKILQPAMAGTIDTAKLDKNDIVATIFDLAIRKYIKLEEKKTVRKLMPDETTQKIIKLKKDDGKLEEFEKTLFNRLFQDGDGDEVKISDLRLDFYKTFSEIEDGVFKKLVEKKYYAKNPKIQKGLLLFLGIVSLFFFNIFLGVTFFLLSRKLNGRTVLGDRMDYQIDGLKLFLKSMNRNYKWQTEQLYIVEQMIPYAIALGYIDKFMEQLKIIKPDYNPTWYSGYHGGFYAGYSGFYMAASSGITTAAPSSSGAGGGGFSGGGGGGGGGGSW